MREFKSAVERLRLAVWPVIVDMWIAGALICFAVLRLIGSNTGKHLLKSVGMR